MAAELRPQFGEFLLDRRNACVWHGAEVLKLKPKAFDVLCYLVEHSGQLVSKDDLWRAIWPDVAVTDGVLAVCLTEIRQALGDDAKAPRFIETVHRRGYRFIASVVEAAAPVSSFSLTMPGGEEERPPPVLRFLEGTNEKNGLAASVQNLESQEQSLASSIQSLESDPHNGSLTTVQAIDPRSQTLDTAVPTRAWSSKKLLWLGAVCVIGVSAFIFAWVSLRTPQAPIYNHEALPLPDKPSLIVLPLVNLSGDAEQDYFSDGLTEVLTGDLSKISSLFVIARNSAFTYKGKAVKVQEVSKEMGVRYVLEGSVQKAEQRVRIAVQLIDATTGYNLWSEQYDRPLTNIFALQDEIVQRIVTTLQLQLTLQEQGILVRKHTNNVEAYDAFLRGETYYARFTKEANTQAQQMYEKALALDPQYAEAYACLGVTYHAEWTMHWSIDPQILERASALAQQAVALDDSLPIAHSLLGNIYVLQQQYDPAIVEGERALALDPNNADNYSNQAMLLNLAGKPEEALRAVEQAMRLNPHSPPTYLLQLGWSNVLTGRYAGAIAALQESINRNPNFLPAYTTQFLSWTLSSQVA